MASTLNKFASYLIAPVTFVVIVAWLLSMPVRASNCRQFFAHHVVQQVVAVQSYAPVYYAAGAGVEQDALAAKITRQVVAQLRQEFTTGLKQQQTANQSAIAIHCGKCHSGAVPKAGIVYDGATLLQCFQVTAALRAISTEEMPKDHKISPEVKGQIMQELLDLEQQADRTKRVEIPPPLPSGELK